MTAVDRALATRLADALEDELPAATELRHRLHADPRAVRRREPIPPRPSSPRWRGAGAGTSRSSPAPDGSCASATRRPTRRAAGRTRRAAARRAERRAVEGARRGRCMRAGTTCTSPHSSRQRARSDACGLAGHRDPAAARGGRAVRRTRHRRLRRADDVRHRCGHRRARAAAARRRRRWRSRPALVNASVDEFEIVDDRPGRARRISAYGRRSGAGVGGSDRQPAADPGPPGRSGRTARSAWSPRCTRGASANVVPGEARARGTLRLMRDDDRAPMAAALTSIVEHTAARVRLHRDRAHRRRRAVRCATTPQLAAATARVARGERLSGRRPTSARSAPTTSRTTAVPCRP